MNEVQSMLQRVRDLAVQYNNGTLSSSDKAAITNEVAQLCAEINRIAGQTKFNDIALLSGGGTITFQVGADDGETVSVNALKLFGSGAGYDIDSTLFNFTGSTVVLASLDDAIDSISTARSTFGAVQNRLQHTLNNLAAYGENLSASESQIKDVDMAAEMVNFTKLQVLQQAGTSMLAQANQSQQSVLKLLQ
jgi:flagellin